jgi:predicted nucleic acid-binding protein
MIGLDTSFFFALADGVPEAVSLYRDAIEEREDLSASSMTVFEIRRHAFRGTLDRNFADDAILVIETTFTRAGVDDLEVLDRAARIAHGMGLAAADALIAASLEHVGCLEFYTADSDFERFEGAMQVVMLDGS